VTAIFAFLAYLLGLLLPFFGLEADYVGAIHLLVYPGAILIFFAFATLTTDQRGHWRQWAGAEGGRRQGSAMALVGGAALGTLLWGALANSLSGSHTLPSELVWGGELWP